MKNRRRILILSAFLFQMTQLNAFVDPGSYLQFLEQMNPSVTIESPSPATQRIDDKIDANKRQADRVEDQIQQDKRDAYRREDRIQEAKREAYRVQEKILEDRRADNRR